MKAERTKKHNKKKEADFESPEFGVGNLRHDAIFMSSRGSVKGTTELEEEEELPSTYNSI